MKNLKTNNIYLIVKIIFLVSATLFFTTLSFSLIQITNSLVETSKNLQRNADEMNANIREISNNINKLGDDIRQDVFLQSKSIENNLFKRVDIIENKLFTQTDRVVSAVDDTRILIKNIDKNLSQNLETSNQVLKETNLLVADTRNQMQMIEKNIEPYINCETNSFCWPNLFQDSLLSIRNVSQDANKTFLLLNESIPLYNDSFLKITNNFEKITENVAKLTKPKWYDRIISSVIGGAAVVASVKR